MIETFRLQYRLYTGAPDPVLKLGTPRRDGSYVAGSQTVAMLGLAVPIGDPHGVRVRVWQEMSIEEAEELARRLLRFVESARRRAPATAPRKCV